MARYLQSLQGPTTALFAIGVLLPVLLATMIPISGIGGSTVYMLGFLLWCGSFSGSGIVWRGERYRLVSGGRMLPKDRTQAAGSSSTRRAV